MPCFQRTKILNSALKLTCLKCQWCAMQLDHVVPNKSRGLTWARWSSLVPKGTGGPNPWGVPRVSIPREILTGSPLDRILVSIGKLQNCNFKICDVTLLSRCFSQYWVGSAAMLCYIQQRTTPRSPPSKNFVVSSPLEAARREALRELHRDHR